jgi:hypothetical protein
MLKAVETVLVVLLAIGIYGGVPALMLWGWARSFGRTQPRTVPVILPLIGFTLGFLGRIIHGSNPRSWAKELRERTGDEAAVPTSAATDTHSQHASLK